MYFFKSPQNEGAAQTPAVAQPGFIPLSQATPNVQESIWSHILRYAVGFDPPHGESSIYELIQRMNRTRFAVSMVSRTFRVCFCL